MKKHTPKRESAKILGALAEIREASRKFEPSLEAANFTSLFKNISVWARNHSQRTGGKFHPLRHIPREVYSVISAIRPDSANNHLTRLFCLFVYACTVQKMSIRELTESGFALLRRWQLNSPGGLESNIPETFNAESVLTGDLLTVREFEFNRLESMAESGFKIIQMVYDCVSQIDAESGPSSTAAASAVQTIKAFFRGPTFERYLANCNSDPFATFLDFFGGDRSKCQTFTDAEPATEPAENSEPETRG